VLTVYVDRRGLARPGAEAVPGLRMVRGAIGPVAFLASIPLARVSPNAAEWSWVSLFGLNLALSRVARASRRRRGAPTS
jgi:hypothetical protein